MRSGDGGGAGVVTLNATRPVTVRRIVARLHSSAQRADGRPISR